MAISRDQSSGRPVEGTPNSTEKSPLSGTDPFRQLVEASAEGSAIIRGRRCVYCNPAFARLFGMASPAEALALEDLFRLVDPADRARVLSDAHRLAPRDPSVPPHHAFPVQRRDGNERWVELDVRNVVWEGSPALHVTGMDVTGRKRTEASRDLLSNAVEQAQEAIYMTDRAGTILYANRTLSRLTGYSHAELIGANPRLFKSAKHDSEYYAAMWKTLLAGDLWAARIVNRRKNGELIELDSRISPVRDDSGKVTHFIGVQYDITNSLALERRLRQADKLETLGLLAGGVAHDFNNLLQVISGWTLLLMDECPPEDKNRGKLEHIDEAVKRAAGLTRKLVSMSRKRVPQFKTVDLNELVHHQTQMLGRLLGEQVELLTVTAAERASIQADPDMVEQVVMNLCINGRDAMPDGGKLIIETCDADLDEDFCRTHLWARPGVYVRLSVSDTGAGMTREVQRKIFEPFFTTKVAGTGTGLGLATVFNIAQQHQALLHVHSGPGLGTMFHVYFPAIAGREPAAVQQRRETIRPGRGEHILLVEDDTAVGEFMRETLLRGGYRVDHAKDGQEAVDLFLRTRDHFDLVILDMVLPKLTGRQVYELLHGLRRETPYLFSSGYSPHMPDLEFIRERDLPLIHKPYGPSTLLGAVAKALHSQGPKPAAPDSPTRSGVGSGG